MEADPLGRIYIADGMSQEIQVFAPDGHPLRTLGGKGRGPGEFSMITGMRWGDQGLWVMDPQTSRLTVFDSTGALLRTVARKPSLSTTIPWVGGLDRDGRVYDTTAPMRTARSADPERLLVRYRTEGNRLEATDTLVLRAVPTELVESRGQGSIHLVGSVPLSSSQYWRLAPDGSVWIGTTGTYRLDRVDFRGDTLATLRHSREPVPVTDRERDSIAVAEGIPAGRIPHVKPAFRSFMVDPEGRVWVEPYRSGSSGTEWDVFSPSGAYLARVRAELRLETEDPLPVVRGDHLYAVTRDEMDVPYVVRLRIPAFHSPTP